MNSPFNPIDWLTGPWVVPLIGIAVCLVAYLVGRRLMVAHAGLAPHEGEEVDSLNISFLGGVTRDRRVAPRRRGNTVQIHVRLDPEADPRIGWVLDRSIGGLGILMDEPLTPGIRVQVRARNAPEPTPWIEAAVRSCRPEGSQYEVGLQFYHLPSWNLMLQFG
ncbi:MAG: PilZ domain-containing protein [Gemmataceae bacterium]